MTAAAGVGLIAGTSSLFDGFYDISAWGPLSLLALAALMLFTVTVRRGPGRLALAAPAALAALSLWQFASQAWAESAAQALLQAQRTAMYAAALGVLVVVIRGGRERIAVLAGLLGGTALAAGVELVALLGSPVPDDFIGGRLNDPLGYTNGQAAALLAGFWPAVALAEWARARVAAAGAVALASAILCLAFMTQSRAALIALGACMLAMLLAFPGRGRRTAVLTLALLALAAAAGPLLDVYESGNERSALPEGDVLRRGVLTLVAVSLAAGGLWLIGSNAWEALAERVEAPRLTRMARRRLAVAGASAAVVVAAVAVGPVARELDRQWTAFRSLEQVEGASRLTTAGGNRYDYWRVAAGQFRSSPLEGIGAGNYDTTYFRERRSTEDVRQPHSLQLQTLAETGLIGLGLGLVVVIGVVGGAVRARLGAASPAERSLCLASAGGFLQWFVHTSVDWMHLLPGLTLGALCCAAVLLSLGQRPRAPAERSPLPGRALVFAVAVLATASTAVAVLADRYRQDARDMLATAPARALERAGDSLRLQDQTLDTHYVIAAAYARLDRYEQARAALQRAWALEPSDFLPPALLGDLATRRGDLEQAERDYAAALGLNPLDPGLRRSHADVAGRLRSGTTPVP